MDMFIRMVNLLCLRQWNEQSIVWSIHRMRPLIALKAAVAKTTVVPMLIQGLHSITNITKNLWTDACQEIASYQSQNSIRLSLVSAIRGQFTNQDFLISPNQDSFTLQFSWASCFDIGKSLFQLSRSSDRVLCRQFVTLIFDIYLEWEINRNIPLKTYNHPNIPMSSAIRTACHEAQINQKIALYAIKLYSRRKQMIVLVELTSLCSNCLTQGIIRQSLRNQGLSNPPLLPLTLSLLSALSPSNRAILPAIRLTRSEVVEVALELGAPCACHHEDPLLSMGVVMSRISCSYLAFLSAMGLHALRISECLLGLRSTLLSILQQRIERFLKTLGKTFMSVADAEKPSNEYMSIGRRFVDDYKGYNR